MTNQNQNPMDGPIIDAGTANNVLAWLYGEANAGRAVVTGGRVRIPFIMPGMAMVIHRVEPQQRVDGKNSGADITDMYGKGLMYSATFMRKLANIVGLSTISSSRCDNGSEPYLREFECVVGGMDLLMRKRQWIGRYELDLREGGAREGSVMSTRASKDIQTKQIREKREHVAQIAETGAFCRACVEALSIPRSLKDVQDPWVPVFVPTIELHAATASPEVLNAMAHAAVSAMMGSFGPPPAPTAYSRPAPMAAPQQAPPMDGFEPMEEPVEGEDFPPLEDEDPPFADNAHPQEAPAPAADDPDRPITDEEKVAIEQLGAWKQPILKECGWPGTGRPTKAVHDAILAKFGGAS